MLAQSLGEYTVKNCLSTLCIHFIPWIQLKVHHFLSVGSNYMETPISPFKICRGSQIFYSTRAQDSPKGLAWPCCVLPPLHRAQLFTFAQGREYKKAMLPWGGLDVSQIPVVKNKTLRKEGRPPGLCRDCTGGGVASAELESSTEKIPVCGTLCSCTSLMLGTGGTRGGWGVCTVGHCVQGSRNKTDVWCRPRRRVLPWTHDQALQAQPRGSPGCSLGRRNSFWREPRL